MKFEYNNIDICKRVRKLRKERGLTQEQLSEKVGLSEVYYGLAERGKGFKLKTLVKICNILDTNLNYLLCGIENKNEDNEIHNLIKEADSEKAYYLEQIIEYTLKIKELDKNK